MGSQKEQRDQLEMKIEDSKKEMDQLKAKMASDNNEKQKM